jgi:RNA polymerase sigma-70 factor (ECF subfamily)
LPHDDLRRRFELLALPHLDAAYNLARWLAGNTTDADDVVQDAYLRAYRYFDSFQGGSFRVWLLTIVRNAFDSQTLGRLMEQLPTEYREVLLLREVEDLAYKEIAEVTGMPIGTVMSRLSRARLNLRKLWLAQAGTEDAHGV